MAILTFCSECKQYVSRKNKQCSRCGTSLHKATKYRVVISLSKNRKLTKVIVGNYTQAKRYELNKLKLLFEKNELGLIRPPFIEECWEKYKEDAQIRKKSFRHDVGRWRKHIQPYVKDLKMDELDPVIAQSIINRLKNYKPATERQVYALLKIFFNWTINRGLYNGPNPMRGVKIRKVDNKQTRCLNREEVKRLLQVLEIWENKRAALIVKFALFTGFRQGEILNLMWEQVGDMIELKNTKGYSNLIPVCSTAREILKEAEQLNKEVPSNYVFPNKKGKKRVSFHKIWDRIRKHAEINNFRFHDLRHTFATKAASSGEIDIYVLQKLLNHQEIKMTQRYANILDEALKKSALKADSFILN